MIVQYILPVRECIEQATQLHDQICFSYCGVCGEYINEYKHDRVYIRTPPPCIQKFFRDSLSYHNYCVKRVSQIFGFRVARYKFAKWNPNVITLELG